MPEVADGASGDQSRQQPAAANAGKSWHSLCPSRSSWGAMTLASSGRPDTEVVFDPSTYVGEVPFGAWHGCDERPLSSGWPRLPSLAGRKAQGSGWCCGAPRSNRCWRDRSFLFLAWGHRDPATPQALGYVRQMMLNMAAPDHSRLRRLLSRSFTRRAVSQLEHRIRGHARAICDRVFTGLRGECDFAKDVAADLPLAYPGRRAWRAAAGPLAAL